MSKDTNMIIRRTLVALALGGVLAACGATQPAAPLPAPTADGQPTAAPTLLPTTAPTSTAQPTTQPTAQPTGRPAANTLPAPLYALEEGQVVRIEVDGTTKTTLTDEEPFAPDALAIVALAVSPADGALAYIVQRPAGGTLVVTDASGENRRALLEDVPVSGPRWSPDGSALAVQVAYPLDDSPWRGGLYIVSAFSGEARLMLASDPPGAGGAGESWGYGPDAWSPDGSKILVSRYSQTVESCDAAILDVATGELTVLTARADDIPSLHVECGSGVWSPDSSTVYVALRRPGLSPREPGLYTAEAATGQMGWVVPAQTNDGTFALVQSFGVGPDGELYALVTRAEHAPDPAGDPAALPLPAALYRVQQGERMLEQLRDETFALYGPAVWAPDGSGVVIPTPRTNGGVAYFFVPMGGEAVPLLIEPTDTVVWGR